MEYTFTIHIDHGVKDFEILSQKDGKAEITVGGTFARDEATATSSVYVNVHNEDTEESVTGWVKATECADRWEAKISVPAGGLYRLDTGLWDEASGRWVEIAYPGDSVYHFGVGDVFLIAGQSNAAGTSRGEGYDPMELGVHVLRSLQKWDIASHPLFYWNWHGPFIAFARMMKRRLGYPIGLIPTAVGGTPMTRWSKDGGDLYARMIDTVKANGITPKAVLWYQGETDGCLNEADKYAERYEKFVADTRADLDNPDLPFFTFQLNRWLDKTTAEIIDAWDKIRDYQRQAVHKIPNTYVIPTIDMRTMSDGIHNSRISSIALGERLARTVLAEQYGIGRLYRAPDMREALTEDFKTVVCRFDNVVSDIMPFELPPERLPMKFEDNAGVAEIASVKCHRGTLTATLARKLGEGARVSLSFGQDPACIIDMGTQLPALAVKDLPIVKKAGAV